MNFLYFATSSFEPKQTPNLLSKSSISTSRTLMSSNSCVVAPSAHSTISPIAATSYRSLNFARAFSDETFEKTPPLLANMWYTSGTIPPEYRRVYLSAIQCFTRESYFSLSFTARRFPGAKTFLLGLSFTSPLLNSQSDLSFTRVTSKARSPLSSSRLLAGKAIINVVLGPYKDTTDATCSRPLRPSSPLPGQIPKIEPTEKLASMMLDPSSGSNPTE
mmetsp:Transcript_26477/g.59726  ORF Transcript_26477/g.59726 Transcript_26477/m.59726 type:complete len:218 (-) Transcript_26477:447-1100(-)